MYIAYGYKSIYPSSLVSAELINVMVIHVATSDDVKTGLYRMILYSHESSALIRVKILDDKVVEGIEAFGVQLIVPDHHKANGVKLGSPSFITVFIRDNGKL